MQRSSVPGEKRIQGNPLEFHLRMFATALRDAGYRDRAMCSKLGLLADLGLWLKRTGPVVTSHLEEHLLEDFVKHKQRMQQMHRGDSKTLQQFLAHLRRRGIVPDQKVIPDQSPSTDIVGRYSSICSRSAGSAQPRSSITCLSFVEKALSRTEPLGIKVARYRPDDKLLAS